MNGTLLDAASQTPVSGHLLMAWRTFFQAGKRLPGTPALTRTASDGSFVFRNIPPGDYVIQIVPTVRGKDRLLTRFVEDDTEQSDSAYVRSYWPGWTDLQSSVPVRVSSGVALGIGRLEVKRTTHYRVAGSVVPNACGPQGTARIGLRIGEEQTQELLGDVRCGSNFLIVGLEPGTYELLASAAQPDGALHGAMPFVVSDQNPIVSVALTRGCDVDVRFRTAEGSRKPDLNKIRVQLRAVASLDPPAILGPPDSDGVIHARNIEIRDQLLSVYGIGADVFAITEIRYNGIIVPDRTIHLNSGTLAHSVEVVVDDKPAFLAGTVGTRDHPVDQAHVTLVKWPTGGTIYTAVQTTTADQDGRFHFSGLPSGEYKIIAVLPQYKDTLEQPYILLTLLSRAQTTTLAANGVQDIRLDVSDPTR
jgi:hypothetical protein